jgi:hypothetical protein
VAHPPWPAWLPITQKDRTQPAHALLPTFCVTLPPLTPDIRLDAPIHDTLRANYLGSCAMTRLAARMPCLRSYVYVSTCYVNINKPQGTLVEERCAGSP